jgi:hypothetical protein
MRKEYDPSDYSFVVKRRGSPAKPWRWEIYCAGRSGPLERSPDFFESMAEAAKSWTIAGPTSRLRPIYETEGPEAMGTPFVGLQEHLTEAHCSGRKLVTHACSGLLPLAAQKRLRRRWLRGKSRVPFPVKTWWRSRNDRR